MAEKHTCDGHTHSSYKSISTIPRMRVSITGMFSKILEWLKNIPVMDTRILGIVDIDLYVPELNFVFGEADVAHGVCIISLVRLHQEFYGLPKNENLFFERALKEAVHEVGHTYRLGHCGDTRCIMHFSNSLQDTDIKGPDFCRRCKLKLR